MKIYFDIKITFCLMFNNRKSYIYVVAVSHRTEKEPKSVALRIISMTVSVELGLDGFVNFIGKFIILELFLFAEDRG